jgi:amino acid transporter
MVTSGTIDSLIDFFSFTAWIFYGGAMLALLVMRKTKKDAPRPYKVFFTFIFSLNSGKIRYCSLYKHF